MPPRLTGHSCVPLDSGFRDCSTSSPKRARDSSSSAIVMDALMRFPRRCGSLLQRGVNGLRLPFYEEGSRLCAARNAEFLKDIGEVIFDRFVAEPQGARDFFVRLSLGDQSEDTLLL